jgi:hypothetical protein
VRDRYGIEELKGVEVNTETMSEIENRVALMRARAEYETGVKQKELRKDKTSVEVNYGDELRDENGILQIRNEGKAPDKLNEVVDRVRAYVVEDAKFEELEKLSPEDLIKRFEDTNNLLVSMEAYYGKDLDLQQRKRLRLALTGLQRQYQEQLASKVAKQWKEVENKPDEWGEIASRAMEKVVKKNRKIFSEKVELKGVDEKEKYENLRKEMYSEGKEAVEHLKKAKYRPGKASGGDTGSEPDDRKWMKDKVWDQINKGLDDILGDSTYRGSCSAQRKRA